MINRFAIMLLACLALTTPATAQIVEDKQDEGGLPKKKHDSKNEPDDHLQCKNETEPF